MENLLVLHVPFTNQAETNKPLSIHLPDRDNITSTHTYELENHWIPKEARKTHIVPGLAHSSIVLIQVLCRAGCKVKYKSNYCNVFQKENAV